MKNQREEWYDAEARVKITLADVMDAAQRLAAGHLCGPASAYFLSEHLAAAALLAAETSEADETLILQMKCAGPLGGVTVECTSEGTLRGYTERKILDDFDGLGKYDARKILGEKAVRAEINLHGSFAQTGRGHGTDKALIAGIMGMEPDDVRIREALALADKAGLAYEFNYSGWDEQEIADWLTLNGVPHQ